ncbi:MAG: GntR family transcriptional regulator [Firmicutes bacterium]|nr:GntR family transcriptional regulator [Bacillota bacterium]
MEEPRYETKKDYIVRRLRQKILDGEYGPGDRLKVRQLAQEFGTSEIPVREAINQLAATGLVTITPHVGAVATPVSSEDLTEIFEIRSALEELATRLATERMPSEALQEIERLAVALENAVEIGQEAEELNRLNRAFHMAIYRQSRNQRLVHMIEELWNHAGRYPAPLTGRDDNTYQSLREHRAIIEALRSRDAERAARLTQEHKNRAMQRVIALVREHESSILRRR